MNYNKYTISSTEKTSKSAAEHETKTLLYLMSYLDESDDIECFSIDVFNDVTAINCDYTKLWDSQSKGDKIISPNGIGNDLVTLYKNYVSIIEFDCYILSIRMVSNKNLIDRAKNKINEAVAQITYNDFTEEAKKEIKSGLIDACKEKGYIKDNDINEKLIDDFLSKVIIVINNDTPENYVKSITFAKDNILNDEVLKDIFKEIKMNQLEIKSSSNINGKKITKAEDIKNWERTISCEKINCFAFSRIVNNDFIERNRFKPYIPIEFMDYLASKNLDEEDRADFLQDCRNDVYKMLTFKSMNKEFWELLQDILRVCKENKNYNIEEIYTMVDKKNMYYRIINKDSMLYFIACMKGGIKYEN